MADYTEKDEAFWARRFARGLTLGIPFFEMSLFDQRNESGLSVTTELLTLLLLGVLTPWPPRNDIDFFFFVVDGATTMVVLPYDVALLS